MIKRKIHYHVLVGVLVALVVVTAGSLISSNMGFKMTRDFTAVGGSLSLYPIALPHLNPWPDALAFLEDMYPPAAGGTLGLRRWDNAANLWVEISKFGTPTWSYAGGNFPLAPGVAYAVRAGNTFAGRTIVGSHDPVFSKTPVTHSFIAGSLSMYGLAITPNSKFANSLEVVEAWYGASSDVVGLRRFDNAANLWIEISKFGTPTWSYAGAPWPIVPGDGYYLRVGNVAGAEATLTEEPYY